MLYHWREKPLGGNSRYLCDSKEIGMMIRTGKIRQTRVR
jgi:hypothetical protein